MTVREATASEHRRANGRDRASVRGRLSTSTGFSGCPQCTRHSLEQRQNGHERARRTADGPAASAHTCVPHSLFPARHAPARRRRRSVLPWYRRDVTAAAWTPCERQWCATLSRPNVATGCGQPAARSPRRARPRRVAGSMWPRQEVVYPTCRYVTYLTIQSILHC